MTARHQSETPSLSRVVTVIAEEGVTFAKPHFVSFPKEWRRGLISIEIDQLYRVARPNITDYITTLPKLQDLDPNRPTDSTYKQRVNLGIQSVQNELTRAAALTLKRHRRRNSSYPLRQVHDELEAVTNRNTSGVLLNGSDPMTTIPRLMFYEIIKNAPTVEQLKISMAKAYHAHINPQATLDLKTGNVVAEQSLVLAGEICSTRRDIPLSYKPEVIVVDDKGLHFTGEPQTTIATFHISQHDQTHGCPALVPSAVFATFNLGRPESEYTNVIAGAYNQILQIMERS